MLNTKARVLSKVFTGCYMVTYWEFIRNIIHMYIFWSIWGSWLLFLSVPDVKYMAPEHVDSRVSRLWCMGSIPMPLVTRCTPDISSIRPRLAGYRALQTRLPKHQLDQQRCCWDRMSLMAPTVPQSELIFQGVISIPCNFCEVQESHTARRYKAIWLCRIHSEWLAEIHSETWSSFPTLPG